MPLPPGCYDSVYGYSFIDLYSQCIPKTKFMTYLFKCVQEEKRNDLHSLGIKYPPSPIPSHSKVSETDINENGEDNNTAFMKENEVGLHYLFCNFILR